jgi:hypothetical protein
MTPYPYFHKTVKNIHSLPLPANLEKLCQNVIWNLILGLQGTKVLN